MAIDLTENQFGYRSVHSRIEHQDGTVTTGECIGVCYFPADGLPVGINKLSQHYSFPVISKAEYHSYLEFGIPEFDLGPIIDWRNVIR